MSGGEESGMELRSMRPSDEQAVRRACREMESDGFDFAFGLTSDTDFGDYLAALERERLGVGLAPERVPATFLLADVDGEIVGRVSVRHWLNDRVHAVGGHIGFGVLPLHRGSGHATQMLTQALDVARKLGIGRVLLTTDETNVASQRVIQRCGGVYERTDPDIGIGMRRYWIDLVP